MFSEIKTTEDIKNFLSKTNALHDGYIIGVQYTNNGIVRIGNFTSFHPEQTKLILQILVTSLGGVVAEIEFEMLSEWQIKDSQWEITDTTVMFNEHGMIIWSDDVYINMEDLKKRSYAIARTMKWRIIE